jgi:hypothetical protein
MHNSKQTPQIATAPLVTPKNVGWTITKVRTPTPPKPSPART